MFKFLDNVCNSYATNTSQHSNVSKILFFASAMLYFTGIFALRITINFEARLLSDVAVGLSFSSNNPLNFHSKILSLQVGVVKGLKNG